MKIYTRTGDKGTTGLFGGVRVSKADPRVDAYGTLDELNAHLGATCTHLAGSYPVDLLTRIQSTLFVVGAELACTPGKEQSMKMALVSDDDAAELERLIDDAETRVEPLRSFVLPGGTLAASELHIARTVCRRAERLCVALGESQAPARDQVIVYLNRLSDLLFVWARAVNAQAGVEDVPWIPRAPSVL